jgi:multidrug efflux pump subunit AcrB
VPLSQIADIRERSGESIVTRENGQRNLTIRIDNRGRDLTSYLKEAQARSRPRSISTRARCGSNGAASSRTRSARKARLAGDPGLVMG